MEAFVPSELLEPVFPMETAVSDPDALITTAPEKLLFVPVIFTPPVPDVLFSPPLPLMVPDKIAVLLALGLLIVRLLERITLLLIVTLGRLVPVWPNTNVGAVAPLLVKASALPEMSRVGAVPEAGPA